MSNVADDVYKAAQIITPFDTRLLTRRWLAEVRASYRFGDL